MKKNYADIAVILDRSGSMSSCVSDTIGGFNTFIEDQKNADGEATISLYQFDDKYEVVYENRDITKAPKLTTKTFVPRGSTALYDAVGRTIDSLGAKYNNMKEDEKPEKIFIVIITDGEENHSTEYSFDKVKEMIEHQQDKYNWQFVFLGAELNAVNTAINMGIHSTHTMNYANNSRGIDASYLSVSKNISKYRSNNVTLGEMAEMSFFEEDDLKKQDDAR